MNLPDALTELGRLLKLPKLTLNEEGICRVVFDEELTLDFESFAEGRMLHLSSIIAPLDEQNRAETFFETLLHANLLGLATAGGHFSVDEANAEVLFERTLIMEEHDATGFVSAVESFVNHLEGWKQQLESPEDDSQGLDALPSGTIRI